MGGKEKKHSRYTTLGLCNGIFLVSTHLGNKDLKPGDVITITSGDFGMDFTIKDTCKDAVFGSGMMGASRLIVSDSDYKNWEK